MGVQIPRECTELLDQQAGILARWQAPLCGLDPDLMDGLLRSGRWQSLYRGVYATYSGAPSRESVLWAAIRRCGPTAALSYQTAAELDRLADRAATVIHVTVDHGQRFVISACEHDPSVPPVVVHRSRRVGAARHPSRLPPRTRIEETALDLAQSAVDFDDAVAWLSRACGRRLTTPDLLGTAMQSRPRMRWRTELTGALGDIGDGVHSIVEFRYVRQVERPHSLPTARRQAKVTLGSRTRYLDNLYSEFGLAIELDGRAAHPAEGRWLDIHRDNALSRDGLATLRYSWSDVTVRPCQTAEEISDALRARGWTGRASKCRSCPLFSRERA